MYKKLLEMAIRELEFCKGTSPFCDKQRIENTLKKIKKSLTSYDKKTINKKRRLGSQPKA